MRCRNRKEENALINACIDIYKTGRQVGQEKPSMPDHVKKLIVFLNRRIELNVLVTQNEDRTLKTVEQGFDGLVQVRNEILSHYKQEGQ